MRRFWWVPLGILLVVMGATLMWPLEQTQTYGMTSSSPIDQVAGATSVSGRLVVGTAAFVVGLMVLAGGIAFGLGRRRSARGGDEDAPSATTATAWWLPIGLVLGIVGALLLWSVQSTMTGAGAGPCADLEPGQTCGGELDTLMLTWSLGALLAVAGLVTIASGIGYRGGRRRAREHPHELVTT